MTKEEKSIKRPILNKVFLVILKYIPHIIAFVYMIYTLLNFIGIDNNIVGCFFHISFFSWIYYILTSIIFRFCYVHRLPLYYILLNESITSIDYYIGIPITDANLIIVHLLLIAILIFGYSFYYLKFKIKMKKYKLPLGILYGRSVNLKGEEYADIEFSKTYKEPITISPKNDFVIGEDVQVTGVNTFTEGNKIKFKNKKSISNVTITDVRTDLKKVLDILTKSGYTIDLEFQTKNGLLWMVGTNSNSQTKTVLIGTETQYCPVEIINDGTNDKISNITLNLVDIPEGFTFDESYLPNDVMGFIDLNVKIVS